MPFSEKTKGEVRRRAAFRCCRCQTIGLDVHHIIPEHEGGTDDISNAAPLCQNCHDQFGANPEKRKEITQMRDWWYETSPNLYSNKLVDVAMLNKINDIVESVQESKSGITELKEMLKEVSAKSIDVITPETARTTASSIVNAATYMGEGIWRNYQCSNCNTRRWLPEGSDTCPDCGAKFT